jgi:hypothetical protein
MKKFNGSRVMGYLQTTGVMGKESTRTAGGLQY